MTSVLGLRLKIFDDLGQTDHDQNNLSFIKSPGAVLSQIVDPLLVLADDSFPRGPRPGIVSPAPRR